MTELICLLIGGGLGWAIGVGQVTKAIAECSMYELKELRRALQSPDGNIFRVDDNFER